MMDENSLIDFDMVLHNTLQLEYKVEMKRKIKQSNISLYKDGRQFVDLSSMMDSADFTDVSDIGFGQSRKEMNICLMVDASINTTDHPNGFPKLNHKTPRDNT